jgi:hypothetical protein
MICKKNVGGWGLVLLLFSMVAGCGSEKNIREGIPALYSEDFSFNTNWIGFLGVEEREVLGADASHDTKVSVDFADYSNYVVVVASRDLYSIPGKSSSCFIYTSRQQISGTKQALDVNKVIVKGLQGGDQTITANDEDLKLTDRAFTGSQVSFEVESNDGAGDFPSFSDQIDAPVFPKLLRLGDLKSPDLSTAPSLGITIQRVDSLIVEWEASNSDYFEFVLVPHSDTGIGDGKLRCIAYDDGYLEVPLDAITVLAQETYPNFQLFIKRHNFKAHMIPNADTPKAAALIDVRSVLEAIVSR